VNTAKCSVSCVIFILLYLENMFQNRKVCELDESILENMTNLLYVTVIMKIRNSVHHLFEHLDFFLLH
jgi:hypothetical protein